MARKQGSGSALISAFIGIALAALAAFGIVSAAGASQGDSNPTQVSQYGDK